ncbi:MAG TPA: hypothetical protein VKC57_12200 [Ktedonobacterales bacterium]|nr:hypothetical protein [Ktedonobacterales bacterium]
MTAREERGERAESARHGRQRRRAEVVSTRAAQSPVRHTDGSAATPMRARSSRARQLAQVDRPAVAPCPELDTLRALVPDQARLHVHAYLCTVMRRRNADDFEALRYRWELHLVELNQLCLVPSVDLSRRKLGHYRAVLRQGSGFPPLIGLGGDNKDVTHDVLLCDGYHRAVAMRDVGMHFAWMWLAVASWESAAEAPVLAGSHEG